MLSLDLTVVPGAPVGPHTLLYVIPFFVFFCLVVLPFFSSLRDCSVHIYFNKYLLLFLLQLVYKVTSKIATKSKCYIWKFFFNCVSMEIYFDHSYIRREIFFVFCLVFPLP